MRLMLLALLIFYSTLSIASEKASVHITATAEDFVGKQLVYHLRETIRGSYGMKLVDSMDQSFVRIKIVTIDPAENSSFQNQTVYSVVWTVSQFNSSVESYWTNQVGLCGRNKTKDCAINIVSQTDEIVSTLRELLLEVLKEGN